MPEDYTNRELGLLINKVIDETKIRHEENKEYLSEIKQDSKDTKLAVQIQNGRVTKLEQWSTEAQKVIEGVASVTTSYKADKNRLWGAYIVLFLLGATIITLSIMDIDSKIKEGITAALSQYEINQ